MLAKATFELFSLFGGEGELRLALRFVKALPENHGDLGSLAWGKPEKRAQCVWSHAGILPQTGTARKPGYGPNAMSISGRPSASAG